MSNTFGRNKTTNLFYSLALSLALVACDQTGSTGSSSAGLNSTKPSAGLKNTTAGGGNSYIYVGSRDGNLEAYVANNGVISGAAIFKQKIGNSVFDLKVSTNQHWLYAISQDDSSLVVFKIEPSSGVPSHVKTYSMKGKSHNGKDGSVWLNNLALSPDGAYVYVAASNIGQLWMFEVNQDSGELYEVANINYGNSNFWLNSIAVDPNGRYVYGGTDSHNGYGLLSYDTLSAYNSKSEPIIAVADNYNNPATWTHSILTNHNPSNAMTYILAKDGSLLNYKMSDGHVVNSQGAYAQTFTPVPTSQCASEYNCGAYFTIAADDSELFIVDSTGALNMVRLDQSNGYWSQSSVVKLTPAVSVTETAVVNSDGSCPSGYALQNAAMSSASQELEPDATIAKCYKTTTSTHFPRAMVVDPVGEYLYTLTADPFSANNAVLETVKIGENLSRQAQIPTGLIAAEKNKGEKVWVDDGTQGGTGGHWETHYTDEVCGYVWREDVVIPVATPYWECIHPDTIPHYGFSMAIAHPAVDYELLDPAPDSILTLDANSNTIHVLLPSDALVGNMKDAFSVSEVDPRTGETKALAVDSQCSASLICTLHISDALIPDAMVSVNVASTETYYGRWLGARSWQFKAADEMKASLVAPTAAEQNQIQLNQTIVLAYPASKVDAKTLNASTVKLNLVSGSSVLAVPLSILGSATNGDNIEFSFKVANTLPYNANFNLLIDGVKSKDGRVISAQSYPLHTRSAETPSLISPTQPELPMVPANASFIVKFAKGVDHNSLTTPGVIQFKVTTNPNMQAIAADPASFVWVDDATLEFKPQQALIANAQYDLYLSNVKDSDGGIETSISYNFYVASGIEANSSLVYPAYGDYASTLNPVIFISYDGELDPAQIAQQNDAVVTLTDTSKRKIPVTTTLVSGNVTRTELQAGGTLSAGKVYEVHVNNVATTAYVGVINTTFRISTAAN